MSNPLRLINPQPMETFPYDHTGMIFLLIEDDEGSYVMTTERPSLVRDWIGDGYTPIAWSYTATSEPIVVSHGYELPPGQGWLHIDSLTPEIIMEHSEPVMQERLLFLYGGRNSDGEDISGMIGGLYDVYRELFGFPTAVVECTVDSREIVQYIAGTDSNIIAYRTVRPLAHGK